MAACFYYIQVFAEGAPTPIFWVLSLLSQPAFAMAIDKVSIGDACKTNTQSTHYIPIIYTIDDVL